MKRKVLGLYSTHLPRPSYARIHTSLENVPCRPMLLSRLASKRLYKLQLRIPAVSPILLREGHFTRSVFKLSHTLGTACTAGTLIAGKLPTRCNGL